VRARLIEIDQAGRHNATGRLGFVGSRAATQSSAHHSGRRPVRRSCPPVTRRDSVRGAHLCASVEHNDWPIHQRVGTACVGWGAGRLRWARGISAALISVVERHAARRIHTQHPKSSIKHPVLNGGRRRIRYPLSSMGYSFTSSICFA
jgi:hypothetical protein